MKIAMKARLWNILLFLWDCLKILKRIYAEELKEYCLDKKDAQKAKHTYVKNVIRPILRRWHFTDSDIDKLINDMIFYVKKIKNKRK